MWQNLTESLAAGTAASQRALLQSVRVATLCSAGAAADDVLRAKQVHCATLRKGGDVHAGLGAVLEMQAFARAAGGGDPWWRIEESKVLWALGEQRLAIALLDTLLRGSSRAPLPGARPLTLATADIMPRTVPPLL